MTHGVVAQLPQRLGRAVPVGLLDLLLSPRGGRTALVSPDVVTQGLATAKVFAFASADYPGAALSLLFDRTTPNCIHLYGRGLPNPASPGLDYELRCEHQPRRADRGDV